MAASLPVISPPSPSEQLGTTLQSLYNMTNTFSFRGTKETEINEGIAKEEFFYLSGGMMSNWEQTTTNITA